MDDGPGRAASRRRDGKTVPVPSDLIEHPKGSVIFETGLHVDAQTDPNTRLGRLAPIHQVGFKPRDELTARLGSQDVEQRKIDFVIDSHLHFNHCGGNEQLPSSSRPVSLYWLDRANCTQILHWFPAADMPGPLAPATERPIIILANMHVRVGFIATLSKASPHF